MRVRQSGSTMVEMLVAAAILGVLITTVFAVYLMGTRASAKGDTQSELLESLRMATLRIGRELEVSAKAGISVNPAQDAIALLSPEDPNGAYLVEPSTPEVHWQKYVIYYRDGSDNTLRRREVVVVVGAPEWSEAGIIDGYDSGSGAQPLDSYTSGGQVVARNISQARFEVNDGLVRTFLQAQKRRYGRTDPETLELTSATYPRN